MSLINPMSTKGDAVSSSWRQWLAQGASRLSVALSAAMLVATACLPGLALLQLEYDQSLNQGSTRTVSPPPPQSVATVTPARTPPPVPTIPSEIVKAEPTDHPVAVVREPVTPQPAPEKPGPEQKSAVDGSSIAGDPPPHTWSQTEVAVAARECERLLAGIDSDVVLLAPIKTGVCGTPAPITLRGFRVPKVDLVPPVVTTCAMAKALHLWMTTKVQPAARELFGSAVKQLAGASSYACRNRNGAVLGPLSEHAFANAVDIAGVTLEDGRTISVLTGWGPAQRDQKLVTAGSSAVNGSDSVMAGVKPAPGTGPRTGNKPKSDDRKTQPAEDSSPAIAPAAMQFLHRIQKDACGIFSTVLGPEANDFHRDHFHFDLKQRKGHAFCE